MAYPVLETGEGATNWASDADPQTANMPSSIVEGDLLIAIHGFDSAVGTIGWTELITGVVSGSYGDY